MAAIRGFSLANISNIRIAFSTFDSRVASARYKVYKYRFPFLNTEKLPHLCACIVSSIVSESIVTCSQ